jgi:hypothetical protein
MSDDLAAIAERVAVGIREQTKNMQGKVKCLMKAFETRISLMEGMSESKARLQMKEIECYVNKTSVKFEAMVKAINNCY